MIDEIKTAVAQACQDLFGLVIEPSVERTHEQFGDYTTNVAMQLAPKLGKSPQEIANAVVGHLHGKEGVRSSEVAGPGFINITLTDGALWQGAEAKTPKSRAGQTIVAEYSDPNPLKPLHAGHLYTTLVGDSIARLLESAGAKVIRVNYGGDVGLHVGKSMWAILRMLGGEHPEKLAGVSEDKRASWLGERYVEGNDAYEDDERAKQEIVEMNRRVYQLHSQDDHDSPFAKVYWTVRQWSYDYFALFYRQLRVTPFDRFIPESEVAQMGLDIVREQLAKGVYEQSQGAVIFEGEPYGLHTRVFINSAGLPTYEAKDVGLLQRKWDDYHFDESIVITANEQAQYYQVMLKSVEQFTPEIARRSKHLTHGVVKLQGGAKMSSRKGNIVSAMDIIEAARVAGQETGRDPSQAVTLAAVKYAFAKNRIGGDIAYDPKESIALEGNSGPYLQYAHARACSILAKSSWQGVALQQGVTLQEGERSLLRKVSEYPEVVDLAGAELMPHHICAYLYELAQTFNRFYETNRIIGDPREQTRLKLVDIYSQTLKSGLELLGIEAPQRM